MPLIHDTEYQKELDNLRETTLKINRRFWWVRLTTSAVILVAASLLIDASDLSSNLKLSLIIVACTLTLIAVVNSAITAIHGSLVIVAGAVEWVGRKQIGEYEEPK